MLPENFGDAYAYRASVIKKIASRPANIQGHQSCQECHETIYNDWSSKTNPHAYKVKCENCHGPGRLHIQYMKEEPRQKSPTESVRPVDGRKECEYCHLKIYERPTTHPVIESAEAHFTDQGTDDPTSKCIDCHDPHAVGLQ